MLVTDDHEASVIYPVVVVVVDGIKCRALLDTGAGSSYVSAALVERLYNPESTKLYSESCKCQREV